jgi:hypothetical protein
VTTLAEEIPGWRMAKGTVRSVMYRGRFIRVGRFIRSQMWGATVVGKMMTFVATSERAATEAAKEWKA